MSNPKRYFITGIDTDSGKTLVSALLVEKFKADYWKPVQAGRPTDTDTITSLVSQERIIHPEGKILQAPMSPHAAAALENTILSIENLSLPKTENTLIIEGAGGLMVPLNDTQLVIEMAKYFNAEVILVSRNYLGSINHTLLSAAYLKANKYVVAGIIFCDKPNPASESIILSHTGLPCLGHIGHVDEVSRSTISRLVTDIQINLSGT
jgi:dethiobiotin synthetase